MTPRDIALFVVRRLLLMGAILVVVSFVIFALLHLAPGSPERSLVGSRPATPELLASIRDQYGLDQPFLAQYTDWASQAASLDLGESILKKQPVADLIEQRLSVSVPLVALAFVIAVVVGLALGVAAGLLRGTVRDQLIVSSTILGVSSPAFVTGLVLLYVFAVELGWFPVAGTGDANLSALTLPALALALAVMALITKITREAVIREASREHVTFARARGLSPSRVLLVHILRNALIPVITSSALVLSLMLGGSVLVETVFSLDGVGSLLVQSINQKDFPVVQGLALMLAVTIIVVNLIVDLLYLVVDPRVRAKYGTA